MGAIRCGNAGSDSDSGDKRNKNITLGQREMGDVHSGSVPSMLQQDGAQKGQELRGLRLVFIDPKDSEDKKPEKPESGTAHTKALRQRTHIALATKPQS